MRKPLLLPRLGAARVDHGLVEEVRRAKARTSHGEGFTVSDRRSRAARTKPLPDDDFYIRMMAAKGLLVRVGAL